MPCSRLHRPPYQLSDSRRICFLQVRPKYTQRAYPEGKLKSAVVMRSLSSLGRYIRGLGARPRIRAVVVISLMSGYITWRSYRLPRSPMWYLGWSKMGKPAIWICQWRDFGDKRLLLQWSGIACLGSWDWLVLLLASSVHNATPLVPINTSIRCD